MILGDVEACLSDAAGIAEVAVVSAGETRRGPGIIAYCVLVCGDGPSRDGLFHRCRRALPAQALPDAIVMVDALPRLASGKVDLQAIIRDAAGRIGR